MRFQILIVCMLVLMGVSLMVPVDAQQVTPEKQTVSASDLRAVAEGFTAAARVIESLQVPATQPAVPQQSLMAAIHIKNDAQKDMLLRIRSGDIDGNYDGVFDESFWLPGQCERYIRLKVPYPQIGLQGQFMQDCWYESKLVARGDVDLSGEVDVEDLQNVVAHLTTQDSRYDVDGTGFVDYADIGIVAKQMEAAASQPVTNFGKFRGTPSTIHFQAIIPPATQPAR